MSVKFLTRRLHCLFLCSLKYMLFPKETDFYFNENLIYNFRNIRKFYFLVCVSSSSLTSCYTKSSFNLSSNRVSSEYSFTYIGCNDKLKATLLFTHSWGKRWTIPKISCKQPRPGFELGLLCLFPLTITVRLRTYSCVRANEQAVGKIPFVCIRV